MGGIQGRKEIFEGEREGKCEGEKGEMSLVKGGSERAKGDRTKRERGVGERKKSIL